jgi:hypothetical protein
MIMVTENTIPVACYDDVNPLEALQAYIYELCLLTPAITKILINRDGEAFFEWNEKKYNAVIYLEDF